MELIDTIRATGLKISIASSCWDNKEDCRATELLKEVRDLLMDYFNIEQDVEVQEGNIRCPMCGHIVIK